MREPDHAALLAPPWRGAPGTQVRLVAVTRCLLPGVDGMQAFVEHVARVSNPAAQAQGREPGRLLAYLIRHRHWSPLEMAHAVVEVECPRDVARQLLRHRSFSFQEWSLRYAAAMAFVARAARRQDHANRQSSHDDLPVWKRWAWASAQHILLRYVALVYAASLRLGVAKETARVILPEGLTLSRLYMAGSVRSWVHYLDVREEAGTQVEHRELARAIRAALAPELPILRRAAADA